MCLHVLQGRVAHHIQLGFQVFLPVKVQSKMGDLLVVVMSERHTYNERIECL